VRRPRGDARVQAIRICVQGHVTFKSNSTSSAIDARIERAGMYRDFAQPKMALCRAVDIPARFATGADSGADPALGPPDFQAYFKVFLGGRWCVFGPTSTVIPMGFVRFGTGRDAADVAFAMIFGSIKSKAPVVRALATEDASLGIVLPHRCGDALWTGVGMAIASGA
jgi:transglutaminase-like putative cysteine protease